ncbi:DNA excision repair protein ERCC-1 [Elysia marginata]|uniref:DNA excision repair protein ERCC-1 n=1 Tax=Elysia marginata TaxID=1093978 RepID=A0AAV4FGL0_9GAST|nr:DNA excision repair protein ERCC-1 [Elysia marginata]
MAARRKFCIPSAEEMECIEREASLEKPELLFKKVTTSSASAAPKQDLQVGTAKNNQETKNQNAVSSSEKDTRRQGDPTTQQGSEMTNHDGSHEQELVSNKSGSSNSLIVNTRQRGNPILKSVRNIPWEYGNIVPDYVMGQSNCALFLSLRYHQLHPNYIHDRLKQLGKSYELRVMLVQVDVKDPHHLLKDLAKMCILADCTLILAFSAEEAGRYLETYKIFENKPPEAIMEKTEENFMAKNLSSVIEASKEDLSFCPGFGPQKANRLYDVFHEPFLRANTRKGLVSGSSSDAPR